MMNIVLKIIVFIFSFGTLLAAPPAQERYLQANKLYEQGEFAKAYDLYKGIHSKSPELLINMGNSVYQLGRFPQALVRWRQAQQQVKRTEYNMLEERITQVQHEHGGQFKSTFMDRIATAIDLYMRSIPHKVWELLFLFLMALGFFLVSWIKHGYWGRIVAWFFPLFVVAAFLVVRYTVQNRLMGFVLRDTQAYVTKDSQARIKASMPVGQEVEVRAIHDTWYMVTDGIVTGWVVQDDIQLV